MDARVLLRFGLNKRIDGLLAEALPILREGIRLLRSKSGFDAGRLGILPRKSKRDKRDSPFFPSSAKRDKRACPFYFCFGERDKRRNPFLLRGAKRDKRKYPFYFRFGERDKRNCPFLPCAGKRDNRENPFLRSPGKRENCENPFLICLGLIQISRGALVISSDPIRLRSCSFHPHEIRSPLLIARAHPPPAAVVGRTGPLPKRAENNDA